MTPFHLLATHCDWMSRLDELVARHPEYGIAADLAGMTVDDLWGTYRHLLNLAEESRA